MKDNNSKQVLLSVLGVAILVVAVVGVSFAAFQFSQTGAKVNQISTGTITMTYTEDVNGINISNAMPVADNVGKAYTEETGSGDQRYVFDFSVGATISGTTTINYAITASKEAESTLPDNAVKVYLTDMDDDADTPVSGFEGGTVPTYDTLEDIGASDASGAQQGQKLLRRGTFTATTTNEYRLRMWVADTYQVQNEAAAQTFKLRVNVYGQAEAQSS